MQLRLPKTSYFWIQKIVYFVARARDNCEDRNRSPELKEATKTSNLEHAAKLRALQECSSSPRTCGGTAGLSLFSRAQTFIQVHVLSFDDPGFVLAAAQKARKHKPAPCHEYASASCTGTSLKEDVATSMFACCLDMKQSGIPPGICASPCHPVEHENLLDPFWELSQLR